MLTWQPREGWRITDVERVTPVGKYTVSIYPDGSCYVLFYPSGHGESSYVRSKYGNVLFGSIEAGLNAVAAHEINAAVSGDADV